MENFARLFILRINLRDSSPGERAEMPTDQEKWRSVDRLLALYGPPDMINHAWAVGSSKKHKLVRKL